MRRALRGATGDDRALRARLLGFLDEIEAPVIAAVWPMAGEPDLRLLMAALHMAGRVVALPVVVARDAPLAFRAWQPGTEMAAGPLGTLHPAHDAPVDPDLILVPLVAFDRARRRLGRGGGFYDRTLAARPGASAVGVGYASREVACVPAGPLDAVLEAVVTEREVIA